MGNFSLYCCFVSRDPAAVGLHSSDPPREPRAASRDPQNKEEPFLPLPPGKKDEDLASSSESSLMKHQPAAVRAIDLKFLRQQQIGADVVIHTPFGQRTLL
jgi:hypothetical protein